MKIQDSITRKFRIAIDDFFENKVSKVRYEIYHEIKCQVDKKLYDFVIPVYYESIKCF
jgi:hypothetical protein